MACELPVPDGVLDTAAAGKVSPGEDLVDVFKYTASGTSCRAKTEDFVESAFSKFWCYARKGEQSFDLGRKENLIIPDGPEQWFYAHPVAEQKQAVTHRIHDGKSENAIDP